MLANFHDARGNAVSFFLGRITTPDKTHREEAIHIKNMVRDAAPDASSRPGQDLLLKDLAAIRGIAEEIRLGPSHFHAVFACAGRQIWKYFTLPISTTLDFLRIGHCFYLAPMARQLQEIVPYCVVLLESGKARAFLCRGTQIRELSGRIPGKDLGLHAQDSRVGWSSHIEANLKEHERTYFTGVSHHIREVLREHQVDHVIISCRDDLWGEIGPQLLGELQGNIIGRFHPMSFEMTPNEVLGSATPVFLDHQRTHVQTVLRQITEKPAQGVFGAQESLNELLNGRVRTLIVNGATGENVFECASCSRITSADTGKCRSCGGEMYTLPAEEGLVRAALRTDAEILFGDGEEHPVFIGVAALLRF